MCLGGTTGVLPDTMRLRVAAKKADLNAAMTRVRVNKVSTWGISLNEDDFFSLFVCVRR